MNQPDITINSYEEYKHEVDSELQRSAESFVRIGYLLKIARDTDILKGSPYANVVEFAKGEYGIDKTVVSKWIHINDRFSEGGYSNVLKEQYRGYGYAKLAIMLQLPDTVNEDLSPAYSKAEIQAIKDEVDEEKKISDMEVYLEGEKHEDLKNNLEKVINQLLEEDTSLYEQLYRAVNKDEDIIEILAPTGENYISVRVQGLGRFGLIITKGQATVSLVNIRSGEKEEYITDELVAYIKTYMVGKTVQEAYENVYNKMFSSNQSTEKVGKVQKAAVEPKPVKKQEPVKKPEYKETTGTEALSEPVKDQTEKTSNLAETTPVPEEKETEKTEIQPKNIKQEEKQEIEPKKTASEIPQNTVDNNIRQDFEDKKTEVAPVQQNLIYRQIASYKNGIADTIDQIDKEWAGQRFKDRPEYKRLIVLASDLKQRLEQLEAAEYGK